MDCNLIKTYYKNGHLWPVDTFSKGIIIPWVESNFPKDFSLVFRIWLAFLCILPISSDLNAQNAPRFVKTDIADSGVKLYLPGTADPVNISYSQDSSKVYTIETIDSTTGDYYHFGSIVAELNGVDLQGQEEEMLIQYMDYLQTALAIESTAGYGKGHTLETHPSAKGVLDYWVDESDDHWIVKGWAAESTIFVMFIYGPSDYPNQNVVDVFFKGARFAGD